MTEVKQKDRQAAFDAIDLAYQDDALSLDERDAERRKVWEGTSSFLPGPRRPFGSRLIFRAIDGDTDAIVKLVIIVVVALIVLGLISSAIDLLTAGMGGGEGFEGDD